MLPSPIKAVKFVTIIVNSLKIFNIFSAYTMNPTDRWIVHVSFKKTVLKYPQNIL